MRTTDKIPSRIRNSWLITAGLTIGNIVRASFNKPKPLSVDEMRYVVDQYYGYRTGEEPVLEGQGANNYVIRSGENSVLRVSKKESTLQKRMTESSLFKYLGGTLAISPAYISQGSIMDKDGKVRNVIEVEQIWGKSLSNRGVP